MLAKTNNVVLIFFANELAYANYERTATMTLQDIKPGQECVITEIRCDNLRKRIIDMGLTTGTYVAVKKLAPLGDPMEIIVRGYLLTLRKTEARHIEVTRKESRA